MKEIIGINLVRMSNAVHYLFVSNILKRAKKDAKLVARLAKFITALIAAVKQEDADLKISQKSLLSDDIAVADKERDKLYMAIKKMIESFIGFSVPEIAEAARILGQVIKDYKIDVNAQLDKETGLMINFIDDLEKKYAEQVAMLNLTVAVAQLKVANEKVRELRDQRTNERMGKTMGALKKSRTTTDEALRQLFLVVNALVLLEGDADYSDFIDYANMEIVQFKRNALGQKVAIKKSGASPSTEAGNKVEKEDSKGSETDKNSGIGSEADKNSSKGKEEKSSMVPDEAPDPSL